MSDREAADAAGRLRSWFGGLLIAVTLSIAVVLFVAAGRMSAPDGVAGGWPAYGGDPGGSRYSALTQINRDNVAGLEIAWTYRTGDVSDGTNTARGTKFEATPILLEGTLYLSTPFNRVIALDPETGRERWSFDPRIDLQEGYSEGLVSRGVAGWSDRERGEGDRCARRIFFGTIDARLIALDAVDGTPCPDFGSDGQVDLTRGLGEVEGGEYEVTSPPTVIDDLVVVGSAMGDNRRVNVEPGVVRAFDARTGELRWAWDPIPRSPEAPGWSEWRPEQARRTGAANAWSVISADPDRGLIFVPTGSAAPDYYGGERLGNNVYANSVVALRATTGEVVWHFQVVHHDLWDYDVAAQPALITLRRDGRDTPAVVVSTKIGHIFVLHRETGVPLFPVEERPVPPSTVAGEEAWPTQPFPVSPPPLHPHVLLPDEIWGSTEEDLAFCRETIESLRYEGIFTPPSLEGSLHYPGTIGGTNWGSVAFQPESGILVVPINRLPKWVRLVPRAEFNAARAAAPDGVQFTGQGGTPYGMSRATLLAPSRLPCTAPPWGTLVAVDLGSGQIKWEVPIGVIPELAHLPEAEGWGSILFGGPIVTGGGLAFVAAGMDDVIRAFDVESGELLWKGVLPAGGQATPMTYRLREDGKQFVVIAAGGHAGLGTTLGDYVVAFALP